jgi:hypothetical protein
MLFRRRVYTQQGNPILLSPDLSVPRIPKVPVPSVHKTLVRPAFPYQSWDGTPQHFNSD